VKQNLGLSAVIIAAIAFVVRSGAPGPPQGQSALTRSAQPQAAANQNAAEAEPLEGPWLATRLFFHAAANPDPPPLAEASVDFKTPASVRECVSGIEKFCGAQMAHYFGIPEGRSNLIEFLIATVPDPLHSRLSLFTDSAIQAIEDGAQASGWIFADQWLPWMDSANPDEKDPEKRRKEREAIRNQEKQPGILVFRRGARKGQPYDPRVLVVFLAGETPTTGVNSPQFQLARAYMRAIYEPPDEVRILGPTFSGSFYSLNALLEEDLRQAPVKQYRVRSGTAQAADDGAVLQRSPRVEFKDAAANTEDQDKYFRRVLTELGIQANEAAQLVEDESAFGAAAARAHPNQGDPGKPIEPIRVFRFPREISYLRNAYRDAVSASKSANSPPPDIEFSIKDPQAGEDSIPIFSPSQSPLSQYGVVTNIADTIRQDGIRLVWVQATNILDVLFLAEVLKRQCPDTRLLLDHSDVLLIQAAQSMPLNGTLVLTTYPAFVASNNWMGGRQKNEPLSFPDANAEGVYNAAVLLLSKDSNASAILKDYHWRYLHHPPMWLMTLDHRGFLPVNTYPHTKLDEQSEKWFQPVDPVDDATPSLAPPPRTWNVVATALALFALALCVWSWWISLHKDCKMDARFSFRRIGTQSGWRHVHLLFFLLVIFSMEVTIGAPGLRPEQPWGFLWLLALSGIAVLATAGASLGNLNQGRKFRIAAVCAALAGAAAFLALWLLACAGSGDRSLFFAFRARELRLGSSPSWPVMASLSALALFEFVQITRLYFSTSRRPIVLTEGLSPALADRLREAWKELNDALNSSFGLRFGAPLRLAVREWLAGRRHAGHPSHAARIRRSNHPLLLIVALLMVGLVVCILFRVNVHMRSIDNRSYNLLTLALHFLVILLLLLSCLHLRLLWRSLQAFLAALGSFPLARSFQAVEGTGADRPLWVRRLNLQSIEIHIQAMYVLHNMTILAKDAVAEDPLHAEYLERLPAYSSEYGKAIRELLRVDTHRTREEILGLMKAMRRVNKEISKESFEFLKSFWATHAIPDPTVPSEQESGNGKPAAETPRSVDPLNQLAGLAQRFVALHYSSFILYGVRQIQNLFLFLSSGFVLLMISLNCYSLQAPRFVSRFLLILFLIIGTATVSSLVGLEKDPILSRMGGSEPGKLNTGFYLKVAAYGALPALSLLASTFPTISNFLLSWVEPTLEAFK
jgi:hypothetical protein